MHYDAWTMARDSDKDKYNNYAGCSCICLREGHKWGNDGIEDSRSVMSQCMISVSA